jgi:hypothetical protein
MQALLDVNVLIALLDTAHVHHAGARARDSCSEGQGGPADRMTRPSPWIRSARSDWASLRLPDGVTLETPDDRLVPLSTDCDREQMCGL